MFKKSTKFLTLLLTVLLVLSSMSVLTVSAATSFSVTDGTTVVSTESNTATYTITNEKEAGWYKILVHSFGAATNQAKRTENGKSVQNYYEVTATIGDESWTDDGVVNTANTYLYPGSFYLEAGEEFTLTLTFNLSQGTDTKQTIKSIGFTKQEAMDISSTEATNIKATDYISADFRRMTGDGESTGFKPTGGTETDWVGKATYDAGDSVVYYVNVPEDTLYEVYTVTSGSNGTAGRFQLYVDGMNYTQSITGDSEAYITTATQTNYYHMYKKLLSNKVRLTAGAHIIKVAVASGSNAGYFGGIKLIPAEDKKVRILENTEFSFYHDMIPGQTAFGSTETSSTTSVSGITPSIGQVRAKSGAYGTYGMYVEDAGYYDISMTGGTRNATLGIYLDGEKLSNTKNYSVSGTLNYKTPYTVKVVELLYLTEGYHTLKFSITGAKNGEFMLYKWNAVRTATTTTLINPTATTEIPGNAKYKSVIASANAGMQNEEKTSPTTSGVYAGKESYGFVVTRSGNAFKYLVISEDTQKYTLSSVVSGTNTGAKIKITDESGTVLYNGTAGNNVNKSTDYYNTVRNKLGEITLKQGMSELTVECSGGAVFLHGLELTPADPHFTFTNGTTAVSDVVEGTMVLTVNLNGNDKDLVIFAIYEESGEFTVLKTAQTATIDGDIATATITGLELEDGKNYYAKAYVWDDVSYSGFVKTLGK